VKLLLTMHDAGTAHTAKVVEELKRVLSGRIYRAVINRTIKFADSTIAGLPIIRFAPHSEAAAEYRDFGREVLRDAKTK
jgi:chromosome partitioning protein